MGIHFAADVLQDRIEIEAFYYIWFKKNVFDYSSARASIKLRREKAFLDKSKNLIEMACLLWEKNLVHQEIKLIHKENFVLMLSRSSVKAFKRGIYSTLKKYKKMRLRRIRFAKLMLNAHNLLLLLYRDYLNLKYTVDHLRTQIENFENWET